MFATSDSMGLSMTATCMYTENAKHNQSTQIAEENHVYGKTGRQWPSTVWLTVANIMRVRLDLQ